MEFNFNLWYESYDPYFAEICHKSFLPDKWVNYQAIDHDKFSGSILKPINRYVEKLYPHPQLISIESGQVRLRQRNHAEIFLLDNDPGFENTFRNVDRPHMRQYYQTRKQFPTEINCFDPVYIFYAPWFLDTNISVKFEGVDESPFVIYPTTETYSEQPRDTRYVEPKFVPFRFKRVGSHMLSPDFGKIPRLSPMFDIVFNADGILIERIEKFYESN